MEGRLDETPEEVPAQREEGEVQQSMMGQKCSSLPPSPTFMNPYPATLSPPPSPIITGTLHIRKTACTLPVFKDHVLCILYNYFPFYFSRFVFVVSFFCLIGLPSKGTIKKGMKCRQKQTLFPPSTTTAEMSTRPPTTTLWPSASASCQDPTVSCHFVWRMKIPHFTLRILFNSVFHWLISATKQAAYPQLGLLTVPCWNNSDQFELDHLTTFQRFAVKMLDLLAKGLQTVTMKLLSREEPRAPFAGTFPTANLSRTTTAAATRQPSQNELLV